MKVWLDKDEKYPDLILSTEEERFAYEIDIPDDLVKQFQEAEKAYLDAEYKIFELWNEAKKVNK